MDELLLIFLNLSFFTVALLLAYLISMKNKKQIHKIFIVTIILMLIWNLGYLLEIYCRIYLNQTVMLFVYLWYLGLCFTPLFLLLTSLVFAKTRIRVIKYWPLFIPPILSFLLIITNDFHHLFYIRFSLYNSEAIFGRYFVIHSLFSYGYMIIGIFNFVFFSIKNSGFFSKQSQFMVLGSLIPLVTNLLITTKIISVPIYTTAISFSVALLFVAVAIFRFQFLSISPIALQTIVDKISDSFVVVNEDNQIIDFNRGMATTFGGIANIARKRGLQETFQKTCLITDEENLIGLIELARKGETSVTCEKHIEEESFDRYFSIEITPVLAQENNLGTIILFKDITDNIKYIETIEEKHAIMMEQERLASLGQLIGGIAHNLKTPIMSIAGATEALRDLIEEYNASIGDACVTLEDHQEIADEMHSWLDKIRPYCSYMSDIIDTVKGQATQLNAAEMMSFTINELIKRIELLMKYELIRHNCSLKTVIDIDEYTELYGDINSLIQVFDNIIINAIQAYEGKNGRIDFSISPAPGGILFRIKDYARGIAENIKDKLLKEMVTTKGKNGTGLGLYMSYATIKGRFGGKMWFESEEGEGTTFYIRLPYKK